MIRSYNTNISRVMQKVKALNEAPPWGVTRQKSSETKYAQTTQIYRKTLLLFCFYNNIETLFWNIP